MRSICISITLALLLVPERTRLRPGFNLFSAQQDVEIGKQVSHDAEKKLKIINNSQVSSYITAVGRRLASRAPGARYPYQFKVVNDAAINAFALPGGFLYINDPRAMAQFFEKIEAQSGSRGAEFFSDHPNPGNRISSVNQEITKLGGANRPKNDSAEFQRIKRILKSK